MSPTQAAPANSYSQRVGANVRLLLAARRITQQHLSNELNLSRIAIARIVQGNRRVDVDDLMALSNWFGVDPMYLLGELPESLREQR